MPGWRLAESAVVGCATLAGPRPEPLLPLRLPEWALPPPVLLWLRGAPDEMPLVLPGWVLGVPDLRQMVEAGRELRRAAGLPAL